MSYCVCTRLSLAVSEVILVEVGRDVIKKATDIRAAYGLKAPGRDSRGHGDSQRRGGILDGGSGL